MTNATLILINNSEVYNFDGLAQILPLVISKYLAQINHNSLEPMNMNLSTADRCDGEYNPVRILCAIEGEGDTQKTQDFLVDRYS